MLVALSPTTGVVQNHVGVVISSSTEGSLPSAGNGTSINKLINGNFDIWQRGTTFGYRSPATEPNRYCADRWKVVNSGAASADRLSLQVNRVPLGVVEH